MTSEIKPRVVYKLVRTDKPEDGTDVYVGSTSLSLKVRLQRHKAASSVRNNKVYTRMREVGTNNWEILTLLVHICDRKTIQEFEKHWVELLKPDLNTYSPSDDNHNANKVKAIIKCYHNSIENKTYYCNICDIAFGFKHNLKRHLKTLKHSNNYMNSVD